MPQDDMRTTPDAHPGWCDPGECGIVRYIAHGHHQSASQVVAADLDSDTVAELHLPSTFPGLQPQTVLMMELSTAGDDCPATYSLTLPQARQLRDAVSHLLDTAGAT